MWRPPPLPSPPLAAASAVARRAVRMYGDMQDSIWTGGGGGYEGGTGRRTTHPIAGREVEKHCQVKSKAKGGGGEDESKAMGKDTS